MGRPFRCARPGADPPRGQGAHGTGRRRRRPLAGPGPRGRGSECTVVFEQLADGFGWTDWREARDSLGSVLGEAGRSAAEVPRAPGGGAGASVDEARKRKTEEKRAEKERKKKAKAEKKREREDTEEEEPPKKQREGGEISES